MSVKRCARADDDGENCTSDKKKADHRLIVDGVHYCKAHAPKTAHRNCTHAMYHPGDRCGWCGTVVPSSVSAAVPNPVGGIVHNHPQGSTSDSQPIPTQDPGLYVYRRTGPS